MSFVRSRRVVTALALATLLSLLPIAASATLIDDDIVIRRISGSIPNINDFPVTVQAGVVEATIQLNHDIEAHSIEVNADILGLGGIGFDSTNQIFQYLDLDFSSNPGPIDGVTLTTNIIGLDASRVSFTADSVELDLTGLSVSGPNPGGFSFALLQVSHTPEPGTALLLSIGLAGLALRRR